MNSYYALCEDDPEQAKSISGQIKKVSGTEVKVFGTELATQRYIAELGKMGEAAPIAWICDGMMLWDYPRRDPVPQTKEARKDGPQLAGERLRKQLRDIRRLRRIPWITYSAIDPATIGYKDNDKDKLNAFLPKTSSIKDVVAKIEELRKAASAMNEDDFDEREWPETDEQESEELRKNPGFHKTLVQGLAVRWEDCIPFKPLPQ